MREKKTHFIFPNIFFFQYKKRTISIIKIIFKKVSFDE